MQTPLVPSISRLLICCVLFALGSSAFAEVRILAYGDSNTWGLNPTIQSEDLTRYSDSQRWAGVMQKALGPGNVVEVDGLPGRSLNFDLANGFGGLSKEDGNGLARLAYALTREAPVNFVVVMLGTNDLIRKPRPSPQQIAAGLEKLVKIVEDNTSPSSTSQKQRLLVVVPVPLGDTSKGPFKDDFDRDAVAESRELAIAFRSEGQRLGVPVFDAGSLIMTRGFDGVHLDAAAHAQLGRALAEQVRSLTRH